MHRKPWTRVSLHRHLLNLLDRPTTSLVFRPKRNGFIATVDFDDYFPPAYVRIECDANSTEPVERLVIHELLHVVLCELLLGKFDETLEEAFILGMENYLWEYVKKSPSRLKKWSKLIEKKRAESSVAQPHTLEQMAERPAQ